MGPTLKKDAHSWIYLPRSRTFREGRSEWVVCYASSVCSSSHLSSASLTAADSSIKNQCPLPRPGTRRGQVRCEGVADALRDDHVVDAVHDERR